MIPFAQTSQRVCCMDFLMLGNQFKKKAEVVFSPLDAAENEVSEIVSPTSRCYRPAHDAEAICENSYGFLKHDTDGALQTRNQRETLRRRGGISDDEESREA